MMNDHLDGSFALMPGQNIPRPSEHDILGQYGQDDGMGLDFELMPEVGRAADSMEIEVGRRQSVEQNFVGPTSPILIKDGLQEESLLGQPDARDFSFNVGGDQSMPPDVEFDAGDLFGPEQPDVSFQFGVTDSPAVPEKKKKRRMAAPGKKSQALIRKRKMIYDERTEIPSKEIHAQLKDTSDITMTFSNPLYFPYFPNSARLNVLFQGVDDPFVAMVMGLPEEVVAALDMDRPFKKQRRNQVAPDEFDEWKENQLASVKSPRGNRQPFQPIDNGGFDNGLDQGFDDGFEQGFENVHGLDSPMREDSVVPDVDETGPFTMVAANTIKTLQSTFESSKTDTVEFRPLTSKQQREEAVRLFFDILVLKTHDVIQVNQATAYGPIEIISTEKLFEIAV